MDQLKSEATIHGSLVRDFFLEYAQGRFAVDDHAEKLLRALVEDKVLEVGPRAPTVSQAAFTGLGMSSSTYAKTPWGPGTIEHYHYRRA